MRPRHLRPRGGGGRLPPLHRRGAGGGYRDFRVDRIRRHEGGPVLLRPRVLSQRRTRRRGQPPRRVHPLLRPAPRGLRGGHPGDLHLPGEGPAPAAPSRGLLGQPGEWGGGRLPPGVSVRRPHLGGSSGGRHLRARGDQRDGDQRLVRQRDSVAGPRDIPAAVPGPQVQRVLRRLLPQRRRQYVRGVREQRLGGLPRRGHPRPGGGARPREAFAARRGLRRYQHCYYIPSGDVRVPEVRLAVAPGRGELAAEDERGQHQPRGFQPRVFHHELRLQEQVHRDHGLPLDHRGTAERARVHPLRSQLGARPLQRRAPQLAARRGAVV
mmetsp:Transcript_42269/g.135314  ORF Transcript_42269/g.135314 Transcript_42269/m.135314 type:complete len:324 (-) Transcript_42269:1761-2732(-)